MNVQAPVITNAHWQRRREVYRFLEEICEDLDLTATQIEKAQRSYEAVAQWLSGSTRHLLRDNDIYPQGSTALGTAIRPLTRDEFDVDLICLMRSGQAYLAPEDLKKIVGDRLKEHGTYGAILEEKKRCWRLNYSGDFHLDISATIPNPQCLNGGELVTDKQLEGWHPTNPKGYRTLFESRALLLPRMRRAFRMTDGKATASIEPFPDSTRAKGVLRRVVQLLKRHRDHHFALVKEDVAPISILITTLAMQSYELCVKRFTFDDELDVLISTIRMMPHFIEREVRDCRHFYAVWNETTSGENFADRWNREEKRAHAFYQWHEQALADFIALRDAQGMDQIAETAKLQYGDKVVQRVIDVRTSSISSARKSGSLFVAPAVGLTIEPATAAVRVPKNDFFGD